MEVDDTIMKFMKRFTILLFFMSLLVACSPAGEPAVSEQQAVPVVEVAAQPTAVPTADTPRTTEADLPVPVIEEPVQDEAAPEAEAVAETAEEPGAASAPPETESQELPETVEETAVSETEAPAAETGSTVVSGRLDEGAFFLGDPNAPITLIDYSDFL